MTEPKQTKTSPKLNMPIIVALIGLVGTICAASIRSPLISNWVASKPTATQVYTQVPSATALPLDTFTPIPPTSTPIPPTPALGIGSTMISDKDGMKLMYVPAGNFQMGCNDLTDAAAHTVDPNAFWIDQTDITNKMYALCVNAGVCKPPIDTNSQTHSSYYGNSQFDNYPVISVNWNMANTYCKWAGRQLPTEAQWEKAARGMNGRTYPWGNDAPNNSLLNYNRDVGDTTAVGSYPSGASPYGALDMAGNVWQWVADWYDANYYNNSPFSNPLGPSSGQYRVLRGGSWDDSANLVLSAYRAGGDSNLTSLSYGFRCALSQ